MVFCRLFCGWNVWRVSCNVDVCEVMCHVHLPCVCWCFMSSLFVFGDFLLHGEHFSSTLSAAIQALPVLLDRWFGVNYASKCASFGFKCWCVLVVSIISEMEQYFWRWKFSLERGCQFLLNPQQKIFSFNFLWNLLCLLLPSKGLKGVFLHLSWRGFVLFSCTSKFHECLQIKTVLLFKAWNFGVHYSQSGKLGGAQFLAIPNHVYL